MVKKHNFIFGGKNGLTGKEYLNMQKTFSELRKGDRIYYCCINENKFDIFEIISINDKNDSFIGRWLIDSPNEEDELYINRSDRSKSISTYLNLIWSTYRLTAGELKNLCK